MSSTGPKWRSRGAPDPNQLDLFAACPPLAAEAVDTGAAPEGPEEPAKTLNGGTSVAILQGSRARLSGPSGEVLAFHAKGETRTLPKNLAEVLLILEAVRPMSRAYAEMASAIRRVGAVLELNLADIPVDPAALALLLAGAHPARIGIRPQRWGRIKSLVRTALSEAGFDVMPGRDIKGLSPAWAALSARLNRRMRYGLSRFFSYCSRRGIAPEAVDQATFEAFLIALTGSSLQARPLALYRNLVNLWNEAVKTVPGWPQTPITPLADKRRSALPAESFPVSFAEDVEACLARQFDPDPFAETYSRPLRLATINARRQQLFQLARALVAAGAPIASITGVAVLIVPANAERALRHLRDAKGGKTTPGLGNLAQTLRSVAQRSGAPAADIARLTSLAKRLHVAQPGMTARNVERLRPFELPVNRQAILGLPGRVVRRAQRAGKGGNIEAVAVMNAVAVAVVTATAMRLGVVTGLEMGRHIRAVRHGRHTTFHLRIPGAEMKAGRPLESILQGETARLLDIYLTKYRPCIEGGAGPYLFPGRGGARRAESRFGAQISQFIHRETGLEMNPHLFRHLCGFLWLMRHPEDIETVRQLLGHANQATTLKFYAQLSTIFAFLKYDKILAEEREGFPRRRSPPRKLLWPKDGE